MQSKSLLALIALLPMVGFAATTPKVIFNPVVTSFQNTSPYTFVLTATKKTSADCVNNCLSSLSSKGTQSLNFTSQTGVITLDYDVKEGSKLVGRITLYATPTATTITNGLGATAIKGQTVTAISYVPPVPLWKGEFTDPKNWKNNNWKITTRLPSWGFENITVRTGIAPDSPSPSGKNYIRVRFPKGSANPGSSPPLPKGGAQFYGAQVNSNAPIILSYWVRYPVDFPFTRSATSKIGTLGKLPGLYSGTGNTGSNVPTGYDGWTIRNMWCDYAKETGRKLVAGAEIVQFTYGSNKGQYSSAKGLFIGCGGATFTPDGKWHHIQMTVHLNDVGKSNGRIDACYDGKPYFSKSSVTFRLTPSLLINGILFQTFFGGDGKEYATPKDTYLDFADFALYQYPQASPPGLCVTNY